ncbi:MAG TPA: hypothetical protein VK691_03105 [Solirubrobacteraceae bacterium]|jgi:hypothetical protein|nr:hypothetical protein [Solirubrobacteraceae bacterium]
MSPSESRNGREVDSIPEGGILAALPRARPQRASARRVAARTSTAAKKGTAASTATKAKSTRTAVTKKHVARESPAVAEPAAVKKTTARKPVAKKAASTKRRVTKPIAKPAEAPTPKQGYEPEEELELGKSVNPPSGVELVESVADIIGELANSGLTAGGRLLKDAFSLLRRP